ncbi:alpha-galactosidase [Hydrogenispora ethanolica]|uniref:Alpha-galactosidase n=1 Tax=Hydrogenispora ethanolica TaxID=1082276 RepID=A0A4R1RWK4_HYDET|nr:alpha-galactosidase [Hydrogenispora ethanolica]TCL70869.1 alpha-galactosidase [Hydrogenispora ethanolica]
MGIVYHEAQRMFHLQSSQMSYGMQVMKSGYLAHLYWGRRLRSLPAGPLLEQQGRPFSVTPDPDDPAFSLDTLAQEYPAYGNSDFREPAFQVQLENGSTVTDLRFHGYRILPGKPGLPGLPATYVETLEEASTLEIELRDELIGLQVLLSYTIYENWNVLTRAVRFHNAGPSNLTLLRALSVSVDFPDNQYDRLHLHGAWARERHPERCPLRNGVQNIASRRGASSHQQNPFLALLRRDATEDHGEVFGFNLVYSGNFLAQAEVGPYFTTRVMLGINPFDFTWRLEPGQTFQTPEAVLVYSPEGLGAMSRTYHRLYRTRLCRGVYRDRVRPILINNWEATYFDFDAAAIERIARSAGELGIELFVLDDGWFGRREDDRSSLGDWFVNRAKLPDGLDDLAGRVNRLGLKFGLWFEPEMVSPDSDLYRKHPDWCLHVPGRGRSQGRNQLILDFSRPEVCEAITAMVSDILRSAPIAYVKWDMNRHMTEIGSAALPPERQRETAHRYMLGLYRVLEALTAAFPEVLFESCSGGGGRFDPGMLYYMPQTWTSDDTDAVERLKIQYGTSLVYPPITMGSHVSAVPNHQLQRVTPLATRALVAMSGNFGFELDLTRLDGAEREAVAAQVALYKEVRPIVQFGDFYRLLSPFETNRAAWLFVSEDKREAFAVYCKILAEPNPGLERLRLQGLNPEFNYRVNGAGIFGGDELLYVGLKIPEPLLLAGDFQSCCWRLEAVRA